MSKIKNFILSALVFIFPLFFLPITQEYFVTNKIYFLAAGGLLLLALSTIELAINKKISWKRSHFDAAILLFIIAVGISIIFASPNKIEALLDPYLGVVSLLSLILFFFHVSQSESKEQTNRLFRTVEYSALLVSSLAIVFFLNPFKNASLPQWLQFLKFSAFTPIGNRLDLGIFIGFFLVMQVGYLIEHNKKDFVFSLTSIFVHTLALGLTIYTIFKPDNPQTALILAPYRYSWYASVEILKNPLSAFFGVGVDNFQSIFTRIKDLSYNQTALWQVGAFTISRSTILHIITEAGLLGLIAFGFVLFTFAKEVQKIAEENPLRGSLLFCAVYLCIIFLVFPPSFIIFFLFFTLAAVLAVENRSQQQSHQEINLAELTPLYIGSILILSAFIVFSGYILSQTYLAEYYFKKSLNGIVNNSLVELYNNQRQATIINPYIERFRINFSQTNLLIANNIVSRKQQSNQQKGQNSKIQFTDQEKQTITQAIQAAINEAKAGVILNPQKSTNWENLAVIYRNILNAVQGADVWTISSYQRAILLDPNNPLYRLNLGGVYYSLARYNDASSLFEQALALKPDWANAHYNLAWASYQQKDYQKAASTMQNVLKLLDKNKDSSDYKKASKELEDFKKKLPQAGSEATQEAQPGSLQLPKSAQPEISPKIQLPKEASPEAK